MVTPNNPAFVSAPVRPFGIGNINIPNNGPGINPIGMSANDFVRSMALDAASRVAPIAVDAATNAVQNLADRFNTTNNNRTGNRSRGNGGRRNSRSRNPSIISDPLTKDSINFNPSNTQVTWSSGIRSGTNVNGRQIETDTFSPLYIQCGTFFPSSDINDATSFYGELLGQDIYRETVSNIQRSVSYRSDRDFTQQQFYQYLNLIVDLLQIYYMVDSILVTCNNDSRNRGIFRLREKLTSDILLQHIRLKEYLETCPIPTNLLNFIRYMFQCHSSSLEKNAPILRLCYQNSLLDDTASLNNLGPETYRELTRDINQPEYTRLMSLLSKAMPEWLHTEMPFSTYEYLYDPQFLTFWFNCASTCSNDGTGIMHVNSIANSTEQYEYYQFTNEVDGGIYACCSAYLTETGRYEPGLWIPVVEYNEHMERSNCTSLLMFRDDLILGVVSLQHRVAAKMLNAPFIKDSDPDHHGWESITVGDSSAHLLQSHCMSNVQQPLSEFIRHLFRP